MKSLFRHLAFGGCVTLAASFAAGCTNDQDLDRSTPSPSPVESLTPPAETSITSANDPLPRDDATIATDPSPTIAPGETAASPLKDRSTPATGTESAPAELPQPPVIPDPDQPTDSPKTETANPNDNSGDTAKQ